MRAHRSVQGTGGVANIGPAVALRRAMLLAFGRACVAAKRHSWTSKPRSLRTATHNPGDRSLFRARNADVQVLLATVTMRRWLLGYCAAAGGSVNQIQ